MRFIAREVTWNNGDILEVGYGMGIAASEIIKSGCRSYTVIEAHPEIAKTARAWTKSLPIKAKVLQGFWQDIVFDLKLKFDGILFDTYPLHSKEKSANHFPFIPVAPNLLKKNGVLTFFSDEKLPFRKRHLDLILANFEEVKLVNVKGLKPPQDCTYWKENYMIIPVCKKR